MCNGTVFVGKFESLSSKTKKEHHPFGWFGIERSDIGLDMHFCPNRAKIEVVTSVCTGHSNSPPDCCMYDRSRPISSTKKISRPKGRHFLCNNPNFEMLRPPGVVFPVKGGSLFLQGGRFQTERGSHLFLCCKSTNPRIFIV